MDVGAVVAYFKKLQRIILEWLRENFQKPGMWIFRSVSTVGLCETPVNYLFQGNVTRLRVLYVNYINEHIIRRSWP